MTPNFLKNCLLLTLFLLSVARTHGGEPILVDEVLRVYDGDTFFVNIKGWPPIVGENIGIRIRGIDTPEIRGKCPKEKSLAVEARDYVELRLKSAETVALSEIERGKYFRLVANVFVDGESLSALLETAKLAREYDGGERKGWCVEDYREVPGSL